MRHFLLKANFLFLNLLISVHAMAQYSHDWTQAYYLPPFIGARVNQPAALFDSTGNFYLASEGLNNNSTNFVKYDLLGMPVWNTSVSTFSLSSELFTDDSLNLYFTTNEGNVYVHLYKYNVNGNLIYHFVDTASKYVFDLASQSGGGLVNIDKEGNIYLSKSSNINSVNADLINKYDRNLALQWHHVFNFGSQYYNSTRFLNIDSRKNLYFNNATMQSPNSICTGRITSIDSLGNTNWSTVISDSTSFTTSPGLIINDSLLVVGVNHFDGTANSKFKIAMLDINGNIKWTYYYATSDSGWDYPFSLSSDGYESIYIIGSKNGIADTSVRANFFLLKLDINGNFIWDKIFNGSYPNGYNGGLQIAWIKDNTLSIIGSVQNTATKNDAYIAILDTSGNVLWNDANDFGQLQNEAWSKFFFDKDSNIFVVGVSDSSTFGNQSFYIFSRYCKNNCTAGLNENESLKFDTPMNPCYPNPADQNTSFDFHPDKKQSVTVTVYDFTGRAIVEIPERSYQVGNYQIYLNTVQLNNGIYFVELRCGNEKKTQKLAVQH